MSPYDILMLVVLVGCTLFGLWKGMAWQLASLASLIVSYMVALKFSDALAPHISDEAPWNRFLAMLILYVVTSLAIWMAFRVVAGIIDKVKLKEFDRQLGAIFGAAKGLALCLIITFFAVSLSESLRAKVQSSQSGHYIARLLDRAGPLIPEQFSEVLNPRVEELKQKLDPNNPADPDADPKLPDGLPDGLIPRTTGRDGTDWLPSGERR
jgi:membrane protein required for colicin V production